MATCKAHAYNPSIYHSSSYINIFHAPRIFHSFNRHGIHTTSILKLPTSFWMVIKILEPEHCRIKSTGPNGGVLWQNWALRLKMTTARAAQPCSSQLQLHTAHILYIQVFGSVRFFFLSWLLVFSVAAAENLPLRQDEWMQKGSSTSYLLQNLNFGIAIHKQYEFQFWFHKCKPTKLARLWHITLLTS